MENSQGNKHGYGCLLVLDFLVIIGLSQEILVSILEENPHPAVCILIGAAIAVGLLFLMRVPIVGYVAKAMYGIIFAVGLYLFISGSKGIMTRMLERNPVQWWIIVVLGLIASVALHIVCYSGFSPSGRRKFSSKKSAPKAARYFYADDDLRDIDTIPTDYEPYNAQKKTSNVEIMIGAFNRAQSRYYDICGKLAEFELEDCPDEFIEICRAVESSYTSLENRMKAYVELCNESDNMRRQEMADDIIQKADAVNEAVVRAESAVRLLKQSKPKEAAEQTSFFHGCNTPEELNKRYRNLTKAFHPDIEAGDEETMKQINAEYNRLKSEFSEHQS